MHFCHACKKPIVISGKVGRRDTCPSCRSDLYCCLNCSFFDPKASKQCREPVAEPVKEKARANYCEYFRFAQSSQDKPGDEKHKALRELDSLFKR